MLTKETVRATLWFCGVVLLEPTAGFPTAELLLPRFNTKCTAISPPPSNETCGLNGSIEVESSLATINGQSMVSQISACRDLCAVRSQSGNIDFSCTGFAFEASTGICQLYSIPSFSDFFRSDPTSLFQIYSQDCFECPNECPVRRETNIVNNGGFESSTQLIGPWFTGRLNHGNGPIEVISPGHNSAHALKAKDFLSLHQIRDVCGGQEYSWSIDIMITAPPKGKGTEQVMLQLGVDQLQMSIEYFLNYTSGSAGAGFGSWRTFQGTTKGRTNDFEQDPNEFSVDFDSKNYTIYVDNFIVKPTQQMQQTIGESLLTNGGFESGSLSPWETRGDPHERGYPVIDRVVPNGLTPGSNYSYHYKAEEFQTPFDVYVCESTGSSSSISSSACQNSCSSACYTVENPYGGRDSGGVEISQNFAALPGQLYQLSFDYRVRHINSLQITIEDPESPGGARVEWNLLGEGLPESYTDLPTINGRLNTFSRVFEATFIKNNIILFFEGFGYEFDRHTDIQIDNISVLAVANG